MGSTPIPVTLSYDPDYFYTIPHFSLVRTVVKDCRALCLPIPARNSIFQRQGTPLVDVLLRCDRTAMNRIHHILDGDSWSDEKLKESRILEIVPGDQMPPPTVRTSSFSRSRPSRGAPVLGAKRAATSPSPDIPHKRMRLLSCTPLPKQAPQELHINAATLAPSCPSALSLLPATPSPGFQDNTATPVPTQVIPLASSSASMTRRLTDAEMRSAIAKVRRQDGMVVATAPSPELPKNLQHLQCPGDAANQSSMCIQQPDIPTNTTTNIQLLHHRDSIRTTTRTSDRIAPSTANLLPPVTRPKSSPVRHGSESPALTNEETKRTENISSEASLSVPSIGDGARGGSVCPSVLPMHHGTVSAAVATLSGLPTSMSSTVKQVACSGVPRVNSHLSIDALSMPGDTRFSRSSVAKCSSDESTRASDEHKSNSKPTYGTPVNRNPPLLSILSLPPWSVSPPSPIHQISTRSGLTAPVRKRRPEVSTTLDPRPRNSARPLVVSPLQSCQISTCNNENADVTIPADATEDTSVPLQRSPGSRVTAINSTSVAVSVHSDSNNAQRDAQKPKVHAGDDEQADVVSSSPTSCSSRAGTVCQGSPTVTCAANSGTVEAKNTRDVRHDMASTFTNPNMSAIDLQSGPFEHRGIGPSQSMVPQTMSAPVATSLAPPILPSHSVIRACQPLRDKPPGRAPISKTPPSPHGCVLSPSSVSSPLSDATLHGEAVASETLSLVEGNPNTALEASLGALPTMRKEQKRMDLRSLTEGDLRLLEGKSRDEDIRLRTTGMLTERILRINTRPDNVTATDERHKTAEERKVGHHCVQSEEFAGGCMKVVSDVGAQRDDPVADTGVMHMLPGLRALRSDPEQAAKQQPASCISKEEALQHTLDVKRTASLQTRCHPEAQKQMYQADPSIYTRNHTALHLELDKERNISAALQHELNTQRSKLAVAEQEMQAVRRECKEPFVVPVLLDLFLRLYRVPYVDRCLDE